MMPDPICRLSTSTKPRPISPDSFGRLLVAQSTIEGITLLTADPLVAQYPAPVQRV